MKKNIVYHLGFYVAILTTILTVITFGIAIFTPPLSGPFCEAFCIEYPFADITSRFPRDYLWMYPAILWMLMVVVVITIDWIVVIISGILLSRLFKRVNKY